jgi:hypothetical protein
MPVPQIHRRQATPATAATKSSQQRCAEELATVPESAENFRPLDFCRRTHAIISAKQLSQPGLTLLQ